MTPTSPPTSANPSSWAPLFGARGAAPAGLSVAFVGRAAAESGTFGAPYDALATRRRRVAVRGARSIGPKGMIGNSRLGVVDVNPRTGLVALDGEPHRSEAADQVSLNRLCLL